MADEEDTCASCSDKFVDLKCAIMCKECKKFYHGACEGITELRGFHMKKPNWKCSVCTKKGWQTMDSVSAPVSAPVCRIKRYKCDSGDVIEVDRVLIENLVSKVEGLTSLTEGLKTQNDNLMSKVDKLTITVAKLEKQLTTVQGDNNYSDSASISLPNKSKSLSGPAAFSYAAAAKTNIDASEEISVVVPNTFVFGDKQNTADSDNKSHANKSATFTANQVQTAVSDAINNLARSNKTEGFQMVKNKRSKRFSKSVVLGTKSTDEGENVSTSFLGTERRQWVYVGRVNAGTSTDSISKYVETNFGASDVKCIQLMKSDEICSFKVGVKESLIPELLKAEKWPKNVAIREFINFPRSSRPPSKTADFAAKSKDFQMPKDASNPA